jgi:hypothetical protein
MNAHDAVLDVSVGDGVVVLKIEIDQLKVDLPKRSLEPRLLRRPNSSDGGAPVID